MTVDSRRISHKLYKLACHYSKVLDRCLGEDLVSAILYGSVARKEASATSDIDLLIIVKGLPKGHFARKELLFEADEEIAQDFEVLHEEGIYTTFSRILKTPEEASRIIPLYLDLVEDAVLLLDREGFFQTVLSRVRNRLETLGARRLASGRIRYWDLKPDLKTGERFTI